METITKTVKLCGWVSGVQKVSCLKCEVSIIMLTMRLLRDGGEIAK